MLLVTRVYHVGTNLDAASQMMGSKIEPDDCINEPLAVPTFPSWVLKSSLPDGRYNQVYIFCIFVSENVCLSDISYVKMTQ